MHNHLAIKQLTLIRREKKSATIKHYI